MLNLSWQPEAVLKDVPPLDLSQSSFHFSSQVQAYRRYYGLDVEANHADISAQLGTMTVAGFKLVAHFYRQANEQAATVYLQHGYYDHVGLYSHVIDHLLAQGYNVFCYDLPGHGLSSGERAAIQSFRQYDSVFEHGLQLLQQTLMGPIIAMGQSTGGAVIINYLLSRKLNRHTSPFDKVILLAPLVRPTQWNRSVLFYYLARPFITQMKREFAKNSHNLEFLQFLSERDPLQPLYLKTNWVGALRKWIVFIESQEPVDLRVSVIQGTDDGTVDGPYNMGVLQQKFRQFEVNYIEQGRHHLANEEPKKLSQLLRFIDAYLQADS